VIELAVPITDRIAKPLAGKANWKGGVEIVDFLDLIITFIVCD
jgi:hypothetical protein